LPRLQNGLCSTRIIGCALVSTPGRRQAMIIKMALIKK